MRKLTKELFLDRAVKKHGARYDYSGSVFLGMDTKIKIICPVHGSFYQTPRHHVNSLGCTKCSGLQKLTIEDFVRNASVAHLNKYDYCLVKEYRSNKSRVPISCPIHGLFLMSYNAHVSHKRGCPRCGRLQANKAMSYPKEHFLSMAQKIHGEKYDYSGINYTSYSSKVAIVCKKHGIFYQSPSAHIVKKNGCPACVGLRPYTTESFIHKAREVHGELYDYSLVRYINAFTKISVLCLKHGEWKTDPHTHLKGSGCPRCKESMGENKISRILNDCEIIFDKQKRFEDCKYKRPLPFDFYIPSHNLLIEFNGGQHYGAAIFGGKRLSQEQLLLIQHRDAIKRKYAQDHGFRFLEIRYDDKNIEDTLLDFLSYLSQ